MRLQTLLAAAVASLCAAEQVTWIGAGSNNLWDNPANWNPSKIPQPVDDVSIPASSDVLIGTPTGARINSLNVASGTKFVVLGCSVTVGPGGASFAGTSTLLIDTGAGIFSSGGTVQVKDSVVVTWHSGHIDGSWNFAPTASFILNEANYLLCTGGDITVSQMTITGGALVNSTCPIHSNGKISVTSTSPSQPTTILQLIVDGPSSLSITGANPVSALNLRHPSPVVISAPLEYRPLANVELWGVQLSSQTTVIEPSTITYHGLNGTGSISTTGAGAVITVSDGAVLTSLTMNNGKLSCINGSVTIVNVEAKDGTFDLPNRCMFTVQEAITTSGNVFFSGSAAIITPTVSFADLVTIDGSIDVTRAAVIGASMTLNGLLTIDKGATLTVSCLPTCPPQNVWSPANAKNPGTLRLLGDVSITAPQAVHLVVNSIIFEGSANLALNSLQSTLDLQNINATFPTLTLKTNTSLLMGETLAIGYGSLVGPAVGQKIGISHDGFYSECSSPCAASPAPGVAYQQYQAAPRS